ncbi:hypothetical protein [Maribacter sp. ACAM166]|uniref:hypothetical protein n=1 Tax=Maribacter sp. ACAM166 TaxID=2508996 RepID=UPI0010FE2579|nr:hypothetical protein [Maribacter sp. ACAM166]TLP74372.1 hypothetical protein ES765_16010 [Maribacter sp. ACAM166]
MDRDRIAYIEIDDLGYLHIGLGLKKFVLIYRTAMEVHWNPEKQTFYSPKPSDWTYLDWYNHILKVVKEKCFCELYLTYETKWVNVLEDLKSGIIKVQIKNGFSKPIRRLVVHSIGFLSL